VVSAIDEIQADVADYEARDLFELYESYEGFETDDDAKGKVTLLVLTLLYLVDKKRGASVKKSLGT
jgi:hypothetical protein